MLDWVTHLLDSLGYPALIFLMMLENVFPSELVMPLAGFTASRGGLLLPGVIGAGTMGAVLNVLPLFWVSRAVGEERLRNWVVRHGKWLTLSLDDVDKAQAWFARWGGWAIIGCRFVPGLRFLISIPAGLSEMRIGAFLGYSAVGAALWSSVLACSGFLLGENYGKVHRYISPIAYVLVALLALMFFRRVLKAQQKSKRQLKAETR